MILWVDCGFRKSIPRYAPEYAHNKIALHRFINNIVLFQMVVLLASVPLFLLVTRNLLNADSSFIYLGCALYIAEGILAILQLIFHAYFWNKQYNLWATSVLVFQMIINLILLMKIEESRFLAMSILATRIIAAGVIMCASFILIKRLKKDEFDPIVQHYDSSFINRKFIKHSALMWASNVIKSLSERNFLVPFFTYTLGPIPANLFKIANDGALFFYRIVIKTIGTTDTALLAHVEASPEKRPHMDVAFKKLIFKMAALSIPMVVVVATLYASKAISLTNQFMSTALTLMAIAYLIESLFLPYERILEVKQEYWYIFYSYIPYVAIVALFISSSIIQRLGLFESILVIHAIRLMSLFAMVAFASKLYATYFPFRFILLVLIYSSVAGLLLVPVVAYLVNGYGASFLNLFC